MTSSSQAWKRPKSPSAGARSLISHLQPGQKIVPRTIYDKLKRYPTMQLGRMDDVAGCRLIFPSISKLTNFRDHLHKSRFQHILRNDKNRYNYITSPKSSGYRGIHDIYSYNVISVKNKHLNGLLIELQYRTSCQHAWATASELIGFFTDNEPKFERGSFEYQHIMRLASEINSRTCEGIKSSLPEMSDNEVVEKFLELDDNIRLMDMFRALNIANIVVRGPKNAIFVFEAGELKVQEFDSASAAWKALLDLEKDDYEKDIVFVCGDTPDAIRLSFINYFSDARGFVEMIEGGCKELMA